MTSTRNRNTELDYILEKNKHENKLKYNLYSHSSAGRPSSECFPELYNPSKLSRDALSNNAIDIESTLLGIGSSNLVNPCTAPVPSLRNLDFKPFFERNNTVIMPYPLVFTNNERPQIG